MHNKKLSLRLHRIERFLTVANELNKTLPPEKRSKTKVFLFTDLGRITLNEDSLSYRSQEIDSETEPVALIINTIEEHSASLDHLETLGESSYFVVKNVELTPLSSPNVTYRLSELVLFADSVKGFTVGSLE